MAQLEIRMAKIEGIIEQVNERMNHLETAVLEMRKEINQMGRKLDSNFKWTLGLILSMWVTIILAVLFKG